MTQNNNSNGKVPSKFLPTKFMLTARVLVGGYLLQTSYSLIEGVVGGEGRDKYFLGAFMVAFTIIGILLILFAGRDLLSGKYVGGALDGGEAPEETAAESMETPENEVKEMAENTQKTEGYLEDTEKEESKK